MNQIHIRMVETEAERAAFWGRLQAYFARDIFPEGGEDLEEFQSEEYRPAIQQLRTRQTDPLHFLFLEREGSVIGFAMPVIYASEDGKCFLLEFCVEPQFRGGGTGTACAWALLDWARGRNAAYFELNAGTDARRRFWARLGFVPNGLDEWGEPLMLLPPEEALPVEVSPLEQADLWQLYHLQNSYKQEIGEEPLTDEGKEALRQAADEGRIVFFLARRAGRCIGMCSAAPLFSTYQCRTMAVFEDFYVEPAWRHTGAARQLAAAAQEWCRTQGISSLWAGCAPCDRAMYRALGFEVPLGELLTWNE